MAVTSTPEAPEGDLVLSLRGIDKNFGAVQALTAIDLDIYSGEVVALVGDNGAGKSTLVKILAGVHPQDGGTIMSGDKRVAINNPADSNNLGIATVYQDLALCDNLDVVDNMFLGREVKRAGLIDDGFASASDICVDEFAKACEEAGIK